MANELFAKLEQANGLPPGLLDAVWAAESGRGKNMLSPVGAQGHFQFMPATAKEYGLKDPLDLTQSATAAARKFADLKRAYGGDVPKMLAAYNWGNGNLNRNGLEKAPAETRNYIQKVSANMGKPAKAEAKPSGRDLSAELFGDTVAPTAAAPVQSAGRDLSAELFGDTPASTDTMTADPTGSTGENIVAGAGKAIHDTYRGAVLRTGQALSNAPASMPLLQGLNMVLEKVGLSPSEAVSDKKAEIAESRKLDAPLMNTGGGIAGNIGATALMLAPTAGANTPLAAGTVGAMTGAVQPALDMKEGLVNTVLGAAGGAGGQWLASKLPNVLRGRVDNAKAAQVANGQKFEAAKLGSRDGYVVPPADLEPGVISEAASAFSGKIKTAQVASQKNQVVTDKLARQALGLKPGEKLDADVLQAIRNKAAQEGYAPIRSAGTVQADQAFFDTLDKIASTQQGAARSFPGLGENGVADMVAKLKQQAFDAGDAIDATRVLRDAADKAYRQGDKGVGKASKQAADALEGMLERHLTAAGNPDALKAFREARTLIAKTYSVQKGLNSETGNVSAQALAKQLQKGKLLSGELKTIGQMGSAFPKATQSLKEAPKDLSPLDMAMAVGGAASGNPLMMAWLGRPVARNALLSGPVQARALQQGPAAPFSQATQKVLENRLAQMLLAPVGTAGAVNVGQ